jgi:hypothetical protein
MCSSDQHVYLGQVDVERLMRLKGTVQAAQATTAATGGEGLIASYPRIHAEVADAVGPDFAEELGRLFPTDLATKGQPWIAQAEEVKSLLAQIAGWLDGMIEAAILDRRIQAEAQAKAKQTGFR